MKTLIWKEFRENRKWLALMSLISMATMAGVLVDSTNYDYYSSPRPNNFRFDGMLTIAFLTIPAAFLMGIAQTIFEIRRDQWAFLTQRVVTKSQIFLSKTIVGLGVCLVVAILPTVMMVVWSWRAERISFDLTDVLIVWAPFFASLSFYFTAILIVCGSSRWYISRLFVIAWPILAFFVWLIYLSEFNLSVTWPIFIWLMFSACVMAIAAWGAFTGYEGNKALRRTARVSWASVLFVAFQAGLVVIYVFSFAGYNEYKRVNRIRPSPRIVNGTDYRIDERGHVIEIDHRYDISYNKDGRIRTQLQVTQAVDLDDPTSEPSKDLYEQMLTRLQSNGPDSMRLPQTEFRLHPLHSQQLARDPFVEGSRFIYEQQQAQWVYSKSRGLFYLFLTDRRDDDGESLPAKLETIIGPDGFTSPGETLPKKRFGRLLLSSHSSYSYGRNRWSGGDGRTFSNRLFHFDDGIYKVDQHKKTVQRLYEAPSGKRICNVISILKSGIVYVLFENEIHVHESKKVVIGTKTDKVLKAEIALRKQKEAATKKEGALENVEPIETQITDLAPGKFLRKISIPPSVAALNRFSFGEVEESGEMVFVARGGNGYALSGDLTRIVKVAANGTITSERDFVTSPAVMQPEEKVISNVIAAMTPVAAVVAVASVGSVLQRSSGIGPGMIERQLTHHPKFWATPLAILLGVGLVFAFIACRRARRRNLSKKQKICWAAIGFIFGPAGLLTLTCMNRIAARVTCGNCGSTTAIDRINCSHCGSQAVVASAKGIEIFDPKLTQAV